jgi:hypothetical protein
MMAAAICMMLTKASQASGCTAKYTRHFVDKIGAAVCIIESHTSGTVILSGSNAIARHLD